MRIKGDFLYPQWVKESSVKMKLKIITLLHEGYIMAEKEYDGDNIYYHFIKGEKKVILTLLCV